MNTEITKTERALDTWEQDHLAKSIAAEQRAYEINLKLNMEIEAERTRNVSAERAEEHARTLERDAICFRRHADFNDARDRRVTWIEAAANYQGEDFAARADSVLAEYDKRFSDA